MRIVCIGGGPAGLYFAILMKRADPAHEVVVVERNRADDTFGFGVVFSDATLGNLAAADPESHAEITRRFAHWDAIDTHVGGEVIRSVGHGFCGLERKQLLTLLGARCRELGVELRFETELDAAAIEVLAETADLIIGADGVSSLVRDRWADHFEPAVDLRPNRFVWLGTSFPFEAFTFYFKESDAGLWRIHAYRYAESGSTFIAECTAETFARTGLAVDDEDATIDYLEAVFAGELAGHRLIKNRSVWRQFPTVRNRRWWARTGAGTPLVLVGDAAHTAHFSIGSGTKLAMEDCIALADAINAAANLEDALVDYERDRRPPVERLQAAAEVSLEWFERTERYAGFPPHQFVFSLLTRSLRVTCDKLRRRDPALVAAVEARHVDPGPAPAPALRLAASAVADLDDDALAARVGDAPVVAVVADGHVRDLARQADRVRNGCAAKVIAELAPASDPDGDIARTLTLAGRADWVV